MTLLLTDDIADNVPLGLLDSNVTSNSNAYAGQGHDMMSKQSIRLMCALVYCFLQQTRQKPNRLRALPSRTAAIISCYLLTETGTYKESLFGSLQET